MLKVIKNLKNNKYGKNNMKKITFKIIGLLMSVTFLVGQSINENLVTIHAEDANLSSILSIIAEDSDFNIVTGPTVSQDKKLTIHLDDTPILEALELIIRASGLSYEVKGNSILVAEASKLNEEIYHNKK